MRIEKEVLVYGGKGQRFVRSLRGKTPLFVCVIGTTETAKIPGISAAGKNPDITDYTPAADVELLFYGKCRSIEGIPVTPDGIPTPAIITHTAIKAAKISKLVVNAGARITPKAPFIDLGGSFGEDIRTGKAVKDVDSVFELAIELGRDLAKVADYLVLGESVPGGTTTALAVLLAMGVNASGKVSSSMRDNPHSLKNEIATQALNASGIRPGDLAEDPLKAISCVGDPTMPVLAGIAMGAAETVPVMLAGGTQMTVPLKIAVALRPALLRRIFIATTKWILQDPASDIRGLVREISNVPILWCNLDFRSSKFSGLRSYESGVVKEGVGAGGVTTAAILAERGKLTTRFLFRQIESNYARLIGAGDPKSKAPSY